MKINRLNLPEGLSENLPEDSRIAPDVLGHRGSNWPVQVPVDEKNDVRSGLLFCSVDSVFRNPNSVFIGFGIPNVFTMVPGGEGKWDKYTAFMFYRQRSYVASDMERMQVGVYFELCDLDPKAIAAIRREMENQKGRRTASCANANAQVLTAAGFTSGGKSLQHVYRPSHLSALLWKNGLEYEGKKVSIRILYAGRGIGDHFLSVWRKEFTSLCRSVKKKFIRHAHSTGTAPQFEVRELVGMSVERWENSKEFAAVGISRPSWFGVWLGFLLGQRPIFNTETGVPIEALELQDALPEFGGKLDRVGKLKKKLFSRRTVRFIRRHLIHSVDQYEDVPRQAIVEMLRRSDGPSHEEAFLYNIVVTGSGIHIARLENRNGRDRKIINWIMAKHVLISGYDEDVRFAGEIWCCKVDGEFVIFLNRNSGTYKPTEDRLIAMADYLSKVFRAKVVISE
ncbi:hypothetical protein [Shimazuella kribbensis]|uniref:hypothetical protein n=1 Tax=Shimazuella kribbensis TaxID=139808 RepID=UPI00041BD69E|nr:hypothetical protein [Shimazuella kribbensis]